MTGQPATNAKVPKLGMPETLRLFGWFLSQYRKQTCIALLLLVVASLMEGIGVLTLLPLVVILFGDSAGEKGQLEQWVLDFVSKTGLPIGIEFFLVGLVVAMTMKAVLTVAAASHVGYGRAQLTEDLRNNLIQALMNARWQYFIGQPAGAVANTMNQEANRGATAYTTALNLCVNFFQVAVYAALAMLVSVQASVVAIFLGLLIYFLVRHLIRKSRSAAFTERESLRNLLTRLVDGLALIKPLKAMGLEQYLAPVLRQETEAVKNAQRRQILLAQTTAAVNEPLLALFLSIGLYLAVTHGNMALPQILFLAFLVYRVMTRIGSLHVLIQKLAINEPALAFIRSAIQDAANACERPHEGLTPSFQETIQLEGVSFSYAEQATIDDVSLTVPAGKFVAIIGPSGAGKTTIVDLITGLLQPHSGRILVDKCALTDIDLKLWREKIGYVPQETFLYHDTIANNISLGDPSVPESDIVSALRAAGASDFVGARKDGLSEIVGERGGRFSNGQRQRLAIARAIVRKPKLLILDEPTSGLDSETESSVLKTLKSLTREMTILAISHQPGVIKAASNVYRIQHGRLVDDLQMRLPSGD